MLPIRHDATVARVMELMTRATGQILRVIHPPARSQHATERAGFSNRDARKPRGRRVQIRSPKDRTPRTRLNLPTKSPGHNTDSLSRVLPTNASRIPAQTVNTLRLTSRHNSLGRVGPLERRPQLLIPVKAPLRQCRPIRIHNLTEDLLHLLTSQSHIIEVQFPEQDRQLVL